MARRGKEQFDAPLERDLNLVRREGLDKLTSRDLTFEILDRMACFEDRLAVLEERQPETGARTLRALSARQVIVMGLEAMGVTDSGRATRALYGLKGAEPSRQALATAARGTRRLTPLRKREIAAGEAYGVGPDQLRQEIAPDLVRELARAIAEIEDTHRNTMAVEGFVTAPSRAETPAKEAPPVAKLRSIKRLEDRQIREIMSAVPADVADQYFSIRFRLQRTDRSPHHLAALLAITTGQGGPEPPPWADLSLPSLVTDCRSDDHFVHLEIAYPLAILGRRLSIANLLSLAWLAAEYSETRNVWVEDIRLPPKALGEFPGPRYGVDGLRESVKIDEERPLISAIVKPRYGGDLKAFEPHAEDALRRGADGLVDDELLVDPDGDFCFERRVSALAELVRTTAASCGESKYYFANITARHSHSEELLEIAKDAGVDGVIANPVTMGYASFEDIVRSAASIDCPVVDCGIGSGILSLPANAAGTSTAVFSKLGRWAGADGFHSGSEGEHWYTPHILQSIISNLTGSMHEMNATLPVIAGAVSAGNVWPKLAPFGIGSMVNAGTGVWMHPDGSGAGAESIRVVLDRISLDEPREDVETRLDDLASEHPALERAFEHFGRAAAIEEAPDPQ